MYTLYWHPWSSSYAPMAVLKELDVGFELHEVDYDGGETEKPEYRHLQPLGLIPALTFDDGQSMFESAAIIIFLCDRHRKAHLAPDTYDPQRAGFLQWMLFLADTVYPSYNRYYHPERYTASSEGAEAVKAQARTLALNQLGIIENHLFANGPWLLGDRFSACDIYLQMITTWHETPQNLFKDMPSVRTLAHEVTLREACRWAIDRHNFATGFEPESV